jgi:hypothetical protein
MKSFYAIIFGVLISINVVFAQRVAMHTLTNFDVNTTNNKFSFDIYSKRTGATPIFVGITNYVIYFNSNGLNTPVLSNINSKYTAGSPTGDYNAMSVNTVLGNQVNVSIIFSGNGLGSGDSLSSIGSVGERICTVTLNITNQNLIAGVSWNTIDSYMAAANPLLTVTNNYQGSYSAPLPVELSAFTAKYKEKNRVDLNWVTKTEVSNYGFYVERSINEGEWNSITFVEGHGNSNSPKEYSYSDKDLFAGGSKFQYRLKQVDTDGQFEYSDVVEVEIMPTKFELSQNYPNPFNPSTTIRFSLPKETQLKINIYNMLGELVQTLAEGTYEAGYHKVTLNASSLPSGAYVYRIESSEFTQVRKMVLIK